MCKLLATISLIGFILLTEGFAAAQSRYYIVRWSPAGDLIAIMNGYTLNIYTPEFNLVHQITIADPDHNVVSDFSLAWSPDATRIAIRFSSNILPQPDRLQIRDVATGAVLAEAYKIESGTPIWWSPDGSQIAAIHTRSRFDVHINIYDSATGALRVDAMPEYTTGYISGAGWINATTFAVAMLDEWYVWDLPSRQPVTTLVRNPYSENVEYNATLTQFAFVAEPANVIQIWRSDSLEPVARLTENTEGIFEFVWRQDRIISTGFDGIARVWDATTFELISSFETGLTFSMDASPAGSQLVLWNEADGIHIRDAATGEILATYHP